MAAPRKTPLKAAGPQDPKVMGLLPSPKVFPWEDAAQCEALEAEVIAQLTPSTPHEHVLAQRIAAA